MPILNFNLSRQAQAINQIVCLYDPGTSIPNSPIGPFQYNVDSFGNFSILSGSELHRDTFVASAGFNASYDMLGGSNFYPLPNNGFVINTPINVYGALANNDNSYSVVQVNTVLANIEPGFSRIRIDYTDTDGDAPPTEYFDCPFYEGWDVTARELNNIVRYMQGAVGFLQREIDGIRSELDFVRSHDFWRGTSVSGLIQWTPATTGLVSGPLSRSQFPHTMEAKSLSNPYPGLAVSADSLKAAVHNIGKTPNGQEFYGYFTNANSDGQWGASVGTYYMCGNTDGTCTFLFFDTILQNTQRVNGGPFNFVTNMTGALDVSSTSASNAWQGLTVFAGGGATGPNPGIGIAGGYTPHSGTYTFTVSPSQARQWPTNVGGGTPWGTSVIGFNKPVTAGVVPVFDPHYNGNVFAFYTIVQPPAATKKIPIFSYISLAQNSFTSNDYYQFALHSFGADIILGGLTGPATLASVNPSTGCPNSQVTLTGSNFDKTYNIYVGDLSHPVFNLVFVNNTTATFYIPQNVPAGPTKIIISNGTYQATVPFFIPGNPSISSVTDAITGKVAVLVAGNGVIVRGTGFGATQGHGIISMVDFVTASQFADITVTSWTDTQIEFTLPLATTPQKYAIGVVANCGADTTIVDVIVGAGPTPILTLSPTLVTLTNNQVEQFTAFLQIGSAPAQDVTVSSSWFVNGVQGGAVGTGIIGTHGLYTAPVIIPPTQLVVTVSAHYVYTNPNNISDPNNGTYTASATVTLTPVAQLVSPYATVTVVSQLNVFLGDGRAGYVPVGDTINAYPGQYVYVQFTEEYDPITKIPVASNTDIQRLTMKNKNALDGDIANEIYNVTGLTIDGSTGRVTTKRTVALGIIDPSDGLWHSMWDIGLPLPVAADDDTAHSLPKSALSLAYYGEDLPAFTPGHPFKGSIVDYINDLAGAHQTQLTHLQRRTNTLVTGNCFYDEVKKTLEVIDPLQVFGVDDQQRYQVVATIGRQTLQVDSGTFAYIDNEELKVSHLGSEVNEHNIVVIGVALDRFYSMWPILPQYSIQLEE